MDPQARKHCSLPGCGQIHHSNGLCGQHNIMLWRGHGQAERALTKRCDCDLCARYRTDHPEEWRRAQHVHHERLRRRRRAAESFTRSQKILITKMLKAGATPAQAAAAAKVSVQAMWAQVDLNYQWGLAINKLLLAARDQGITHGREYAYKNRGCRCPDCRAWNRERRRGERNQPKPPTAIERASACCYDES